MTERQYFKKDGGTMILNPNVVSPLILRRTPDNQIEVSWNGYILRYTKYAKLDRVFEDLNKLRFEVWGIIEPTE